MKGLKAKNRPDQSVSERFLMRQTLWKLPNRVVDELGGALIFHFRVDQLRRRVDRRTNQLFSA